MSTWPNDLVYEVSSLASLREGGAKNQVRDASSELMTAIGGLSALGPPQGLLWRGHGRESWRLESTGFRKGGSSGGQPYCGEEGMITSAKAAGIDNSQHFSDLEVLARLRHHGAANRLIDVSSDPLTALWFAVSYEGDHDGLLLCFDKGAFMSIDKPWEVSYASLSGDGDGRVRRRFSVGPLDARIAAQRGSFIYTTEPTDQGCSEVPIDTPQGWVGKKAQERLEKLCSGQPWSNAKGKPVEKFPSIVGVLVPRQVKEMLRDVLERSYGLSRTSIYPDFPGLGDEFSIKPHL